MTWLRVSICIVNVTLWPVSRFTEQSGDLLHELLRFLHIAIRLLVKSIGRPIQSFGAPTSPARKLFRDLAAYCSASAYSPSRNLANTCSPLSLSHFRLIRFLSSMILFLFRRQVSGTLMQKLGEHRRNAVTKLSCACSRRGRSRAIDSPSWILTGPGSAGHVLNAGTSAESGRKQRGSGT